MLNGEVDFMPYKIAAFLFIIGVILFLISIYDKNLSEKDQNGLKIAAYFFGFLAIIIVIFFISMVPDPY